MSTKKPAKEKCSFRIVNAAGTSLSFNVDGSVVLGMVEAFSWLSPERRLSMLARLEKKQEELLAKEAARADTKTGDLFEGAGA